MTDGSVLPGPRSGGGAARSSEHKGCADGCQEGAEIRAEGSKAAAKIKSKANTKSKAKTKSSAGTVRRKAKSPSQPSAKSKPATKTKPKPTIKPSSMTPAKSKPTGCRINE